VWYRRAVGERGGSKKGGWGKVGREQNRTGEGEGRGGLGKCGGSGWGGGTG